MRRSFWFFFLMWAGSSFAQDATSKQKSFSSNSLSYKNPSTSISFTGYYRFLGFVRKQQETFPNNKRHFLIIVVKH